MSLQIAARTIAVAALAAGWTADVSAEIYACTGEDGVTSYQDQPCPEPEPAVEPAEAKAGRDAVRETRQAAETARPADPGLVAACKKRYRDEIDRLDAEIREGIRDDEREAYREQARALSQQLSRCDYGGTHSTGGDRGPEPAGRDL